MKFIHIADVHLGAAPDSAMPWGEQRAREIWSSLEHIISVCNEEEVDLLLIAGDLFHRQPLVRELKEADYLFQKLVATRVVIMAGNHDYISARSNYQGFTWNDRVSMYYNNTVEVMDFPEINTQVYGFSYLQRDILEPLYDEAKPQQNEEIHILLAHGGDDKDIPINRKKLQEAGFDYIALGHIHKPEIINNRMAYAGSLEPLDKNEIGERGYILGEIVTTNEGLKKTNIRFVPSSFREYKKITLTADSSTTNGSLKDQAQKAMKDHGEHNIYLFEIQGVREEGVHFDKEGIKAIGNVLEVVDKSVPDYDFDAIYRDNTDNLIGLFIQKIRENADQGDVAKKALYYGLEALLGARDQ